MPSFTEENLFEILTILKGCAQKGEWFFARIATKKIRLLGMGGMTGGVFRFLKKHGYAESRYRSPAAEYRLTDKAYEPGIPDRDTKFRQVRIGQLKQEIEYLEREIKQLTAQKATRQRELKKLKS